MTKSFSDMLAASHAVLVDLLGVLGAYRSQLVIIGGWVPELRFPGKGHPGSLDVDLAVDTRLLPPGPYSTMCQRLVEAGYRQHDAPHIFQREVDVGTEVKTVRVDLLAGEYADSIERQQSQRAQELHLAALRGVDVALDSCDEIRIDGERPDGALDVVTARVATVEAFICMKAFAMVDRAKKKDAFDIYFCLRHSDIDEVATNLRALLPNGLVEEAMRHLADKFATIDQAGPKDAASVAAENGEAPEQAQRAAFELTRMLLGQIGA